MMNRRRAAKVQKELRRNRERERTILRQRWKCSVEQKEDLRQKSKLKLKQWMKTVTQYMKKNGLTIQTGNRKRKKILLFLL